MRVGGRTSSLLALVLAITASCGFPRDTGSTLHDVRNKVLHVGVTSNPPWVVTNGDAPPAGAEAVLVERLAARLDARVEWYPGSESELMAALKDRVLDVVVGGLDDAAPWTEQAALTRPYVTMRTVVAAPDGVAVPDDLDGTRVAVQAGTADIAALLAEGADAVPVKEVTGREGLPVAVGEWQATELGFSPSRHELAADKHVWALPPGENAWLAEVEDFLLGLSAGEVTDLLIAAERAGAGG